jgi:hypothetical protein
MHLTVGTALDGGEGFAILTRVIPSGDWIASAWARHPASESIFGIRLLSERRSADPDSPSLGEVMRLIRGETKEEEGYRCAAQVAMDLGWDEAEEEGTGSPPSVQSVQ